MVAHIDRSNAATVLAVLIAGVLGGALVVLRAREVPGSLVSGDGVPCVHSAQVLRDAPERYPTSAAAIEADAYAREERDLVEDVPEHPAFHRFRNETAIYWVEDAYDGSGWKVIDRYRLGPCERDAFTGRRFTADEDRPLRACDLDDPAPGPAPPDVDLYDPDSPWVCSAEHLGTPGRWLPRNRPGPGAGA